VYFGTVVPTADGDYTVHITGTVGSVQVDHTAKLDKVDLPSENAFPSSHGTVGDLQAMQLLLWIAAGTAAVLALLALVIAIVALKRKPRVIAAPNAPARQPIVGTPIRPVGATPPAPVRRAPPPPGRT
jgi:hypothetical protein